MMEVVVTSGAISRAKLQSYRYHQQTNTLLFCLTSVNYWQAVMYKFYNHFMIVV